MKKILIVTRSRSLVNDLAARRRFSSRFFLMPAHDLDEARATLSLTKVHLVVVEMGLSNLDGFRLLAALQAGTASPPVVAVCENIDSPDCRLDELVGLFRVIKQPVNFEALLELVHEQLDDFIDRNSGRSLTPHSVLRLIELERQTLVCECRHEESGTQWIFHFKDGQLADARRDGAPDDSARSQIAALERATIQIRGHAALAAEAEPPVPEPAVENPLPPLEAGEAAAPPVDPPERNRPEPFPTAIEPAPTVTPQPPAEAPRRAVIRQMLEAIGEVRSLAGALLVNEAGEVEESFGALEERTRREVGQAIRLVFSGAAMVVGHLLPDSFQGLTLEADGHVVSCWQMNQRFLALLVTDPRDLGLIRVKMPLVLPRLRELADG